jgi:hypothetical protein
MNNALPKRSPSHVPMVDGMTMTFLHDHNDCKTCKIQMHKIHEQKG